MPRPRSVVLSLAALVPMAPAPAQELPEWVATEEVRYLVAPPSETSFPDIRQVLPGPGGRMYVGLYHLRQVRVFDAEGSLEATFGRAGNEPGQMGGIGHMGWAGDTLFVVDGIFRRIVFFGPDGTPRGDRDLGNGSGNRRPAVPDRLLPEGRAFFVQTVLTPEPERRPVATVFLHGDLGTADPDTILTIPWGEQQKTVVFGEGERRTRVRSLYQHGPLHSVGDDGNRFVILERPVPPSGAGGEYVVTKLTATGDTVWRRAYPYQPEPVDRARVHAAYAGGLVQALGLGEQAALAEVRRKLLLPAFAPPVTAIHLGTDGSIWLRDWAGFNPGRRWIVLDPAGEPTASVELPSGFDLRRASRDAVFATFREGDALSVVRYRLGPSRGAAGPPGR